MVLTDLMLNQTLLSLDTYASKLISSKAKLNPEIKDLSFGEPIFGPPEYLLQEIKNKDLTLDTFLRSVKKYEDPKGSIELREAISSWYKRRYGLNLDPETEIMITHGGVEAITLAILSTAEKDESVIVTDPSYMLYERTIKALGRCPVSIQRPTSNYQYASMLEEGNFKKNNVHEARAIVVNSPENPSGYILSSEDWHALAQYSTTNNLWIIHDEVYDTMSYFRDHIPATLVKGLEDRTILINSFSKKFGIPGLRIGWMVAKEEVINLALKLHDYIYLGVNIQYEQIGTRLLSDKNIDDWLFHHSKNLKARCQKAMTMLTDLNGYNWLRKPFGAMFLFPEVTGLYSNLPLDYKNSYSKIGEAVAHYLFNEKKVAVVPGHVYGDSSENYIRIVLCSSEEDYKIAIEKLSN